MRERGRQHDSFAVMLSLIEAPAALASASAAGGERREKERELLESGE